MSAFIRLDRLLSNRGYASRKEVKALIKQKRVLVSGQEPKSSEQKVAPEDVLIDKQQLDPENLILALHKPTGLCCSHTEADSIFELLPERYLRRKPKLACAGRLDKDASGLVILSDDGDLVHRLTAPRKKIPKHYKLRLSAELQSNSAEIFSSGRLRLKGETEDLLPAELKILGPKEVEVVLMEGRYHQLKRMFAAIGNHVESLERTRIGSFALGDLGPAEVKLLTPEEVKLLFSVLPTNKFC